MKWIRFKYKGERWEVQKDFSQKCKYKDIKIPKGWQLIPVEMIGYLYDKKLIDFSEEQWLEHYSKEMKERGLVCFAGLSSYWGFVVRLGVLGNNWDDDWDGCVFGVRFVRKVKK